MIQSPTENGYPSLQQLYPSLSAEELRIASENIDRYIQLILRICKRIEADQIAGQEHKVD